MAWSRIRKGETRRRLMAVTLQSGNAPRYLRISVIFLKVYSPMEVAGSGAGARGRGRGILGRGCAWVARLRDCTSPGWYSRWNTRDGGGPTLLGGVKEVGGVGHPRTSTLTPRVSESFVCPPGSLRSHIHQSADPSRFSAPSSNEARRAAIWSSSSFGVTVDFFKIQRSAWRAWKTKRRDRQ